MTPQSLQGDTRALRPGVQALAGMHVIEIHFVNPFGADPSGPFIGFA